MVEQDGMSALMHAAKSGNAATVKALVDAGADVTIRSKVNLCFM